jgi:myo-inositol-1(or 4)-monophosphatase
MEQKVAMYAAAGGIVCRGNRNFGTAALHLAYVAAGRLSAFFQLDLHAWDIAAGALLVKEAGGRVDDAAGRPYSLRTRNICITNGQPGLHAELLAHLVAVNAKLFVDKTIANDPRV